MSEKNMFRLLKANEIDCRVATISEKGLSILLYKDARVDQNILDETIGPMNWQRHHSRDNANCIVSIWDVEKKQWIEKEDTGTESYTEKEKGLASDSFKRACFNWGIGRELYSAPFIWIDAKNVKIANKNQKLTTYDKFIVEYIDYDSERNISALKIKNTRTSQVVYSFGSNACKQNTPSPEQKSTSVQAKINILTKKCETDNISVAKLCHIYKVDNIARMTESKLENALEHWDSVKKTCGRVE